MSSSSPKTEFERLHDEAVERGDRYYIDPTSGFLVMTALHHHDRGECCGNRCRHCPFDHRSC